MPTKAELRKQMLQHRLQLSTDQVFADSQCIYRNLLDQFGLSGINCLHIFLPIPDKNELNTWLIVQEIWQAHPQIKIAVPVTLPKTDQLVHRVITPGTTLVKSKFGIEEPDESSPSVSETEIDMVLVPLLAFDVAGHRVGYGKGYYDRFLAKCKPNALKIGLSLFPPVPEISDIGSWDMQLDYCITPAKVYRFGDKQR